jgi:hypothetical protein
VESIFAKFHDDLSSTSAMVEKGMFVYSEYCMIDTI